MKSLIVRVAVLVTVLGIAACGGYDRKVPSSPTAPSIPDGGLPGDIVMESSQGLAPAGFQLVSHTNPKAGEDGVIRAESPITVDFDLCGSTVNEGGRPWFLFDFDFDHVPDVIGRSESCHQTHTYRIPRDAAQDLVVGANFCFANADPSAHRPGTYFSCRSVKIALPHFPDAAAGCYEIDGEDASFFWPGGKGPIDPPLFSDATCTLAAMDDLGPLVFAPSASEAKRQCGGADFVLEIHRNFFLCDPVV